MKKIIFACAAVLAITLLYFWKDIWGFSTLDKAVQSQWETPVHVVNKDMINRLVIYKDQDQYVFGVFHLKDGRYYYKNDNQSSGSTASSDRGPALLVRVEPKKHKGNFIWGALYSDITIEKFEIEYKNGEIQEVESINNTFIHKVPKAYEDEQNLMTIFTNVKAYDKDNNIIQTLN
jgi:hypothetical protein